MISFNPSILNLGSSEENGKPYLLGSRCCICGKFFFPQQTVCTACLKEGTLKEHPLSCEGKIYAYTIVERESLAPSGFEVPYAYGYIDLPEGVRVLSKIVGWEPATLKIGAAVRLILEEFRIDREGQKIIGFRFQMV